MKEDQHHDPRVVDQRSQAQQTVGAAADHPRPHHAARLGILLYESISDDDRRANVFGLLMSLNMLIEVPDGFDYTGAQCRGWLRDAGFRETYVEHLVGPDSMVVGVK